MRITNNTITYNFLVSLNKSLERQNLIQEQLSDGKAVHRPSDNPIKAIRSLRFNTNLSVNDQYLQNIKDAQSWMQNTDSIMSDLSSIMIRVRELVGGAANGTNPPDAVQAVGHEVDNLINQVINIANSKIGDRYLFAGQKDKTLPFVRTGDVVTYNGDNNKISMPIKPGAVNPDEDSVNLTGIDVFNSSKDGSTLDVLNHLIEIKQHLMSAAPADQKWLSETGLDYIEKDHAYILQAQTQLGTRMAMYEMAEKMMEQRDTVITGDVAANEDLDIPRAIIDFKNSENVYKTALSVGARIMPPSLVDFLK